MKIAELVEAKAKVDSKPESFLNDLLKGLDQSAAGPNFDISDSKKHDGKKTEVFVSYSGWDALLYIEVKKNGVKCKITHSEQNRGDSDEEDEATFPMQPPKFVADDIGEWVGSFMHNLGDYDEDEDSDEDY